MNRALAALAVLAAAGTIGAQVNPGGKMVDTKDGIVFQKFTPTPRPTWEKPDGGAAYAPAPAAPAKAATPSGPAVVEAAYATFRGTLVRVEKGEAITIRDGRTGKERRLLLAKGAAVPEGLKEGDAVSVRVPLEEGSGARTADRVELQKTPAALDPKSKFTQASPPASR